MERREHQRISDTLLLEMENGYGMVVDMSIQGMRVSPDHLPNKQHITLRMKLNDQIIDLEGEVCWHTERASHSGQPEVGIRLLKIPHSYIAYIRSLMTKPEYQDEEHKLDHIFENRCNVTINPDSLRRGVFDLELPERELPVRQEYHVENDSALAKIFSS